MVVALIDCNHHVITALFEYSGSLACGLMPKRRFSCEMSYIIVTLDMSIESFGQNTKNEGPDLLAHQCIQC